MKSVKSEMGEQPKIFHGTFTCSNMSLDSLEGSPERIAGDFHCYKNKLKSLEGGPMYVNKDYFCYSNLLESLEGSPEQINGSFNCRNNKLKSLKGGPRNVAKVYDCSGNFLKSLEGGPQIVIGIFDCSNNLLESFRGIYKYINEIHGSLYFGGNPIKSHVLGLFYIKGLKEISGGSANNWTKIVNKHISKGIKGLLDCQKELIKNGFQEYAQI